MNYINFSKILKVENGRFNRLRYYPKYRFDKLYYKFSIDSLKPFELSHVREEWKEIISLFDKLNKSVWKLAKFRRRVREWNGRKIDRLYSMVFNLELLVRLIYERILGVSAEEEIVWRNYVINLVYGILLDEYKIKMTRDDIRELMPSAGLSAFRIMLRQTFPPVIQLLNAILSDLKNNTVDDSKLDQLEDVLLLKIIPWWYRVFERSISLS